jgi:hypothetical protein
MILQTAFAAETHLAEGLTLKLRCTVKVEQSLTDLAIIITGRLVTEIKKQDLLAHDL